MSRIAEILESFQEDPERKGHMDLLVEAFFENIEFDGNCEFGSIGLDCKRPFGKWKTSCQNI